MPTQEPVVGIVAGNRGTFTAVAVDAQGDVAHIPAGLVPIWFSSDSINAPVVASADGLSAHVDIPANVDTSTVTSFNLLMSCLVIGVTIQGHVTVPILPIPNISPVAFVITQNS